MLMRLIKNSKEGRSMGRVGKRNRMKEGERKEKQVNVSKVLTGESAH